MEKTEPSDAILSSLQSSTGPDDRVDPQMEKQGKRSRMQGKYLKLIKSRNYLKLSTGKTILSNQVRKKTHFLPELWPQSDWHSFTQRSKERVRMPRPLAEGNTIWICAGKKTGS